MDKKQLIAMFGILFVVIGSRYFFDYTPGSRVIRRIEQLETREKCAREGHQFKYKSVVSNFFMERISQMVYVWDANDPNNEFGPDIDMVYHYNYSKRYKCKVCNEEKDVECSQEEGKVIYELMNAETL